MDESNLLGRVVSVSGAHVIIALDACDVGRLPVQIGNLVKIRAATSEIFAMVSSLSIPVPARSMDDHEYRIADLDVLGEHVVEGPGAGQFRRGASGSPGLSDLVYLASADDLRIVYAGSNKKTVPIGELHQDRSITANIVLDDLLGRHFAVVGTTGSGKSCAVSVILQGLISSNGAARIILLDLHGEYHQAFGDLAETIDPQSLQLPYWLLTHEELVEVVLGPDWRDSPAEADTLRDLVQAAKVRHGGENAEAGDVITADTPVPFKLGDLLRLLEDTMGKLERRHDIAPFLRLKARLTALLSDRRFGFMFPNNVLVRDSMASILSRIFRVPVNGKPLSIVDLSTVPSEVINVVVAVLCRMAFSLALWSDKSLPTLLVCEEAHRYAPDRGGNFGLARTALRRLAREGRKFGISLCLVTQRPSELCPSVLSQCNTIFAMRVTSEADQDCLGRNVSEATRGLVDPLPTLGNSEAVAIGEGVPVPMRLTFKQLPADRRPSSNSASFSRAWAHDDTDRDLIAGIVQRWRRQR